jgi:hypothetical protein
MSAKILMILLALSMFSCSSDSEITDREIDLLQREKELLEKENELLKQEQSLSDSAIPEVITEVDTRTNIIKNGKVGPFIIGDEMPEDGSFEGFTIEKKVETINGEEGPYEDVIWRVYRNGELALELNRGYDLQAGHYINKIGEINILSTYFETAKGTKVGSTLTQIYSNYNSPRLWFSYVGGLHVCDTDDLDQVQFVVNTKDFIGNSADLYSSDMVNTTVSDYKSPAHIVRIRVY